MTTRGYHPFTITQRIAQPTQENPMPDTTSPTDQHLEGWAFPTTTARKAHFFRGPDRRSLCGRYALLIVARGQEPTPDTGGRGPDDCKACADRLEATR